MPHPIEASTLRILKPTGETVGTGFLVSKNLAVTCAHVVKILGAGAGDTIDIRFTGKSTSTSAHVLPEYWRPDDSTDIAILQVDDVPEGVFPLRMGRASESRLKNDLYTFGYAIAGEEQGIGGLGTFITLKQEGNFIQFRMHEANHGHSGAPIYDDQRGVVVGMIKKGHTGAGRNAETTFAIPAETIWQVCPQLKPPTPILPRRNPIVEGINLLPYDYDQRIQNFLTEYLGTDSHPVPFGGRDDALKMLNTWLAETPPYLLLAAPAGRGKSALLVRWLDSLKAREDLALAFVPVSIRFGTNMERIFYAALAARLAYLHGDDIPASPETSTAVYRGLVADYLSKPLANGRTLLVVLDGLDEAADWQAGADFMPGELPAGVRVVVSARFLAGDANSTPWLRRLNWERNGLASAPSLTPLDRAGVADVLLKMGCPLDELSRQVDIVAELYRLSAGDPLLVGLYVGDLWAKGEEVTRLKPENLAGIQPGYKGYFDRWWDDQKKLWGKDKPWLEKHVRAVRNLLAGALGPLFRDDFLALEPELESDYIVDALDVLQRFIIGDNQIQGYTFSHPKLGQYFWDEITPNEQARMDELFLHWGEEIVQGFVKGNHDPKKTHKIPAYVLLNYTTHLVRTNQPVEKFLPLVEYHFWAQAWVEFESLYGGQSGYRQDIERVRQRCQIEDRQSVAKFGYARHLGYQVRCALIEASLHSISGVIPVDLIPVLIISGKWALPQIFTFIRQIPKSYQQSQALITLLPYISEEHMPDALKIARAIKDEAYRAEALIKVIERLHKVDKNLIQDAIAISWNKKAQAEVLIALAKRLPDTSLEVILDAAEPLEEMERSRVLGVLVARLPDKKVDQILANARAMEGEISRAYLLSSLAPNRPDIKAEALAAVQKVPNFDDYLLLDMAENLPELLDKALKIIASASPKRDTISEFIEKISKFAQNLPEEKLELVVTLIRKTPYSSYKFLLIALIQRMPNLANDALTETLAETGFYHPYLLNELGQHCPDEMLVQVVNAALKLEFDYDRANALNSLVHRLPESELPRILLEARALQSEVDRTKVLCTLSQRMPEIAGELMATRWMIRDESRQARFFGSMAKYIHQASLKAIAIAQGIGDSYSRTKVIAELIPLIPKEFLGKIVSLAEQERDEYDLAQELPILAQYLPTNDLQIIFKLSQLIQNENQRAKVLSELAHKMPQKELHLILRAVCQFRDDNDRAIILNRLAKRLSQKETGDALQIAFSIQETSSRALALCGFVQHWPEVITKIMGAIGTLNDEGYHSYRSAYIMKELAISLLSEKQPTIEDTFFIQILDSLNLLMPSRFRFPRRLSRQQQEAAIKQILIFMPSINSDDRAEVLAVLAKFMPEQELDQLLEIARTINPNVDIFGNGMRVEALCILAQRIPEKNIGQVFQIGQGIKDESNRARVMSKLVQQFPKKVFEELQTIPAEYIWPKACLLNGLVVFFPEVLDDAMQMTLLVADEESRYQFWENLALQLIKSPAPKSYKPVEITLSELSANTRSDLFNDLATLMPAIIHLGTPETPGEIYQAVCDVTTWWP